MDREHNRQGNSSAPGGVEPEMAHSYENYGEGVEQQNYYYQEQHFAPQAYGYHQMMDAAHWGPHVMHQHPTPPPHQGYQQPIFG
jgi:hypothetical protein